MKLSATTLKVASPLGIAVTGLAVIGLVRVAKGTAYLADCFISGAVFAHENGRIASTSEAQMIALSKKAKYRL